MKRQKPFFTESQLEKIVETITTEMTIEGRHYDDKTVEAIRKYVQAPKHAYENAVLYGVLEGRYTACVLNGEMAYKVVAPPSPLSRQEMDEVQKRAAQLSHALFQVEKSPKLEL